ncbi:hypothetical protein SAMN05878503_103141 [Cereibacter ovatus]|uniref:Uncharacterized protein n=1 Tax=Cereibacter ovatus TaxID=439529 RepID=A0A285CNM0_9RHOB|nr:hypothetical protein [Cereibacter ovatus]SNX69154.1 hypothetical protein SAMN05878503_103141 [Cereibacter ovatus]
MTPTTLAEAIADCHATRARARRMGVAFVILATATGALLGFWALNSLTMAAAGAMVLATVAAVPAALRSMGASRRLARLEADHPAIFPTAIERYRMVMATERASRYKLYC